MPMPKKPRSKCLYCYKEPRRASYKYCSNKCQKNFEYERYIEKWKNGEERGLQGLGIVSAHVKRYLRAKYENKCILCGWSVRNEFTGLVPLVADHIDGNWRNNYESNLRLICPNCDALSETYGAHLKGNGRNSRRLSKRARDAKTLMGKVSKG